MAKKSKDMSGPINQHKKMAMGLPIPQGPVKGKSRAKTGRSSGKKS